MLDSIGFVGGLWLELYGVARLFAGLLSAYPRLRVASRHPPPFLLISPAVGWFGRIAPNRANVIARLSPRTLTLSALAQTLTFLACAVPQRDLACDQLRGGGEAPRRAFEALSGQYTHLFPSLALHDHSS